MADLFDFAPEPDQPKKAPEPAIPAAEKPQALSRAAPPSAASSGYGADSIEVLEGLEPVRKRPGMYIGGTDERALHHLFAEVLDNAMDEAVARHAKIITVELGADGFLAVTDDGRGIPVDPHPRHPDKSALEVVMTVLHSGGKFSGKAYETSGGLHGVGVSVVNALSEHLEATVWRDGFEHQQRFSRGLPLGPIQQLGSSRRKGTRIRFKPDDEIFGAGTAFKPARLYRMARSKAYLFRGVTIEWRCAAEIAGDTPDKATFHFPNGLADYLAERIGEQETVTPAFSGRIERKGDAGAVEWAVTWSPAGFGDHDSFVQSYCNTVPTPDGGTHEAGFRAALSKGLKAYADLVGEKRAGILTAEDTVSAAGALVSVFIKNPEFQGQTKDRLSSADAQRLVETALRDPFDHWLTESPARANALLSFVLDRAEERLKRRKDKEVARASATKKLRLPGKLADCSQTGAQGAELFIVEGDSAGGSAKQARDRATQAILPLRGKILNVERARFDKMLSSDQVGTLITALGAGIGRDDFDIEKIRYHRIVIMTDADVDGAHIRTLLLTFFYRQMPQVIERGYLYIAQPPLYKASKGKSIRYLKDDAELDTYLVDEGVDGATLDLASGERLAGQDLLELVQAARGAKANIERLSSRAPAFAIEQAALAGLMGNADDVAEAARRLDLYAEEGDGAWTGARAEAGGYMFSRVRRGVTERLMLDELLLQAADARRLAERAAKMAETFEKPALFTRRDRTATVRGPLDLVGAVLDGGRRGLSIQRYKGLGEMNAEQLWETTLDVEARTLLQVRVNHADDADDMFSRLMGELVEPRREFIQANALDAEVDV